MLQAPSAETVARLTQRAEPIAKGEQHWTDALHTAAPVELPYPRRNAADTAEAAAPLRFSLDSAPHGATTVAAFQAWLSALTGQTRVSVLYTDAGLAEGCAGLEPWLTALGTAHRGKRRAGHHARSGGQGRDAASPARAPPAR